MSATTEVTEGMKVLVAGRYAAQGQIPQAGVVLEISGEWALISLGGLKVWREMARITRAA